MSQYQPQQPQDQSGFQQPQGQFDNAAYAAPSQYSSYGAQPGVASTKTTFSTWGLWLGIASLVLLQWAFLPGVAGGVLSVVGLVKEPAGKTKAIWGLVTSGLSILAGIVFWIVVPLIFLGIFAASVSEYSTYSTY